MRKLKEKGMRKLERFKCKEVKEKEGFREAKKEWD